MYCLFPRRSFLATRLYSKRSSLAGRNHFRKYLLHSLAVRGVDMTSGCQPCLSPLLPPHNQKGPRTRLKQLLQLFSSSLNTAKIAISQEVSFSNLFCCNRTWELGLKVTGGCKKKKRHRLRGWRGMVSSVSMNQKQHSGHRTCGGKDVLKRARRWPEWRPCENCHRSYVHPVRKGDSSVG